MIKRHTNLRLLTLFTHAAVSTDKIPATAEMADCGAARANSLSTDGSEPL